jgi:N6-adenosine-specific RNA methylase IME4
MTTALAVPAPGGLPSIEKARALLTQCRSVQEVMRIKALAQAVASCANAEGARDEAAAIVLLARRRCGEIETEIKATPPEVSGARGGHAKAGTVGRSQVEQPSRTERLAVEGRSRKTAAEDQKLAALPAPEFDRMLERGIKTATAAVTLAKLPPPQRAQVLGKLGDDADIKKAIGAVKLEKKAEQAEALRAVPLPAPKGPYRVIVVDPPWQYEKRSEDITHRGRNPYPDMSTDAICALPVSTLAEPDAILWLWTTNAFMRDAFRCLDAWGFREKTILTWVKDRMGTGDWLRGKTEHALLAVRGRPLVMLTNQTTELRAPLREHSRKPDEFFALVDALCPGTKLEMFARETRAGWGSWGAETERFS